MTLATRIAVMHQGEVQQFADPDTVYNRPANLFVARFMGAPPMNTLPARVDAEDGRHVAPCWAMAVSGCRCRRPRTLGHYAGRDVVLGIRPECIAEPNRRLRGRT